MPGELAGHRFTRLGGPVQCEFMLDIVCHSAHMKDEGVVDHSTVVKGLKKYHLARTSLIPGFLVGPSGIHAGWGIEINCRLEAESTLALAGLPSGGQAVTLTPLAPLYSTGPCCPVLAIIRHTSLDLDLGPRPAWLIRPTLHCRSMTSIVQQDSSLGSCLTILSPKPPL